jgi:hypothetical protein
MNIMSNDNSELNAYLKNEWKNDRTWLAKGPDCCPDREGIIEAAVAKFRKVRKALEDTYGEIACCL